MSVLHSVSASAEILEIIDNDSDYKDVQFKISVASKTKYCVDIYNVGNGFNLIKCLDALQDDKYKFHVISNSLGTYMDALEIENFNQVFIF